MQNKKTSNGKRVRTPITTSSPKPESNKPSKDPKVTTLLMAGGLAVAAVMVIAVVFMFVVRGKSTDMQSSAPAKEQIVIESADASQVMDAVYLSLFTYGLDKNSIKEKTEVESDTKAQIKMMIDPFHIEEIELKQTIAFKLTQLGMTLTDDGGIIAANDKVKLIITFKAPVIIDKPKPNSIAFVIDDCGYSMSLAKELTDIPYPITLAVLPHTEYAEQTAKLTKKKGKTLFLHQPMQPISYPKTDPGKGAVLLNMPAKIVKASIEKNVKSLGADIDGFNNHMGSALTQDNEKMRQVFSYIKKYTKTFVDSYTAKETVAYDECKTAGFKCGLNKKFIDNETDYTYIRSKIIEGANIAREEGHVIMIGHLRESTVDALKIIMPELEKAGYNLVSATELAVK